LLIQISNHTTAAEGAAAAASGVNDAFLVADVASHLKIVSAALHNLVGNLNLIIATAKGTFSTLPSLQKALLALFTAGSTSAAIIAANINPPSLSQVPQNRPTQPGTATDLQPSRTTATSSPLSSSSTPTQSYIMVTVDNLSKADVSQVWANLGIDGSQGTYYSSVGVGINSAGLNNSQIIRINKEPDVSILDM
jgi:hypothetical protein